MLTAISFGFVSRAVFVSQSLRASATAIQSRKFGSSQKSQAPQRIDNVLVIGSGLMGAGIAQVAATSGKFKSVALNDVSDVQLGNAKARITESIGRLLKRKQVNVSSVDEAVNRITFTKEVKPVSTENLLVVEAITELLKPKQELFKTLYEQYGEKKDVILVTNTSFLSVGEIGLHVTNKDRFGGLHFFNPVAVMKLVEVIRVEDGTDEGTQKALVQFGEDVGKVPVVAKDVPGFIVNRLLKPYMMEALGMLERGDATFRDIDTAMKLGAGYPMGPFELMGEQ